MAHTDPSPPPDDAPRRADADPAAGLRTTHFVRHALHGDRSSLDWLVRRFSPVLRAQAEYRLDSRLRARIDPADLVNDVWVRALPRIDEFTFEGPRSTPPFLRFLSSILLHQVNNLYRKHLRGKPAVVSTDDSVAEVPEPFRESARAISQVVRDEEQAAVERALAALDPDDREVIVLRGIEQHPTAEVALLFGVKPNTISVRYRRALERLRALLPHGIADELPGPDDGAQDD